MTTAVDIASYIESRFKWGFDNTKTQKLVYLSNAWSLAWTGKPLTANPFEAWVNGPVERELWKLQRYSFVPKYEGQLSAEDRELIDSVLAAYSGMSALELVEISHESPWLAARGDTPPKVPSSAVVDAKLVREHYSRLAMAGEGPKRLGSARIADARSVAETARTVSARWKEALDLLASR
ncbi:hypothetical protein B7R21_16020 [Subtercola boreus]|uniref:Antitoxin SocA-like Panacea domain-containing protein n=1 Tax=Subtercola boreus TaxID=120213 RepID=A0A3E0VDQ0_9MICO|nr:Panacea domain-containing protein [Subtercola boreus]RFA07673.1 hypothetical protein B7R21_16020 [Subtercola boreus]